MRIVVESDNLNQAKQLISAAIQNELKILTLGIKKTKQNIKNYEAIYNSNTEAFYKKYSTGKLGDDIQYIKWAGEYETLLKLQKDYTEIEGTQIC